MQNMMALAMAAPFIAPMSGMMRVDAVPSLASGQPLPPSVSLARRFENFELPESLRNDLNALERGQFGGDAGQLLAQLHLTLNQFQRGITSSMTAFPVRENLEAEARVLVPQETPLRNRIPRVAGSGTAAAWKQITSLGGGWGSSYDQPGGGSASQIFFSETGAPASLTTVYANKSASYKLMGQMGSVTGFAMASGANFFNQYDREKTNAILNLMLCEEFSIINADATSTAVPFGGGSNALSFNGVLNLTTTANGVPAAQVQTSVGALTFAHIDNQLIRQWKQGARGRYMVVNAQEALSIKNLAIASGTVHRVVLSQTNTTIGIVPTGYLCPITGEVVQIITSRFMPAGTIWFGADQLPNGDAALQMDVLPQVELPELAADQMIQGYVAQEIAPSVTAPQVYPFLVSVFEVLKMKGATVFAKSTGVTAVS